MRNNPPKAVAIVAGSDTVSTAIGSMNCLRSNLPLWCDIVLSYSTAPRSVTGRVRTAAGSRPVTILESSTWLPHNELRNRALAAIPPYDYYLFLEPDSRIAPGTLERCIKTHRDTRAELVGGVILYGASIDYGRKDKKVVHFAGGECRFRPDADGRPGCELLHPWMPRCLDELRDEIGDQPWDTRIIEFHGCCMTRRAIDALTPLDINHLVTETVDLGLQASRQGLRMVMDAGFEVTYERAAECLCDVRPYSELWGKQAVQDSVRYFATKYGLPPDCEFVDHQSKWNRQHYEDIGVVTRPVFPTPYLTDLRVHPFAQSWPQLSNQLRQQRWSAREIDAAKRCHDVGQRLADGHYRPSGKPVIGHLIGTASILAAYGAPPILIESALVHAAYDELGVGLDEFGHGSTAKALTQRVGLNVDRVIRAYARQDFFATLPPETEDDFAMYPLDDARTLLIRVAKAIEGCLDGHCANGSPPADLLLQHARKVLPILGFDNLLQTLEIAITGSEAIADSLPDRPVANIRQPCPPLSPSTSDALALPDQKWVEVASFLRRHGRQNDVAAAPEEFAYLCENIRYEFLPEDPSKILNPRAIVILHKGRLLDHSQAALAALRSATPIFANEVFILFSGVGKLIPREARIHQGALH
jgi:hypothetical protein